MPATITYTYQWQDSADGTTGWANVVGQTSSTYTVVSGELTKFIRCQVTASDDGGSTGPVNSNALGPITAAPTGGVPPHRIRVGTGISI